MSPYETDPAKIPSNDRYADIPLYGRYGPAVDDFKPQLEHINSTSPQSLRYWEGVLSLCNDSTLAYKNELDDDGRDVFALGSVIVKSGHLHETPTRDYSYNDANEVAAVAIAQQPLAKLGVKVPEIYFTGKVCASRHAYFCYDKRRLTHSGPLRSMVAMFLFNREYPVLGSTLLSSTWALMTWRASRSKHA